MYYTIINRIKSGSKVLYNVKDLDGCIKTINSEAVKELIRNKNNTVSNATIQSDGRLRVTNKHIKTRKYINGVTIYTGDELLEFVRTNNLYNRQRDIVKEITDYVSYTSNYNRNKMLIISGLRRTGKTVSMIQAIANMIRNGISPNSIVFIDINKVTANCSVICSILDKLSQKYIFIDEATFIGDFISNGARLYSYSRIDKRIIMSGTDSLVFPISLHTTLLDRAYMLRSTHISYKEYTRLFGENVNYYQNGGTLTHDMEYGLRTYVDERLVNNIVNTIKRNESFDFELNGYGSIAKADRETMIYNVVYTLTSVTNTIGKSGINVNLNNKQIIDVVRDIVETETINLEPLKGLVREIVQALRELDIISYIPNMAIDNAHIKRETNSEYVCSIQSLTYILLGHMYRLNMDKSSVNGKSMENLVLSECYEHFNKTNVKVGYYRYKHGNNTHEVDVVINYELSDRYEVTLIEVKHANKPESSFAKHLVDDSLKFIAKNIRNRYVVYLGKTQKIRDIQYINLYEFLLNLDKWI